MKNPYKSFEMQTGSGLKIFLSGWPFERLVAYFCNRLEIFIHIFSDQLRL